MAAQSAMPHADEEGDRLAGVLFRLSARFALLVFVGVLWFSFDGGVDPTIGFLRALGALLALTVFGWVAEQAVRNAPKREPEPAAIEGSPTTTAATDATADEETELQAA